MRFNSLRFWLAKLSRGARSRRRSANARRPAMFRPHVEAFEERLLLDAVRWINPDGGAWNVAANWDAGRVPTAGDDVTIDMPVTVTHSTPNDGIQTLRISSATLVLSGGGFVNTTITTDTPIRVRNSIPTLDGVTLTGNLDLATQNVAVLILKNGFTLNGVAYLGNDTGSTSGHLYFQSSERIGGMGTIEFGGSTGNTLLLDTPMATVTLGPNVLVHGKAGAVRATYTNTTLVNQGAIRADTAGGTISINPTIWSNTGTIGAAGGTLTTAGTWSNSGTISVTGGTLNLGGTFALGDVAHFTRSGGTVNVTGTLDLQGGMLALNAATGSLNIGSGGTIKNGAISEAGGAQLVPTSYCYLDAITFNGDLDSGAALHLRNGFTLHGTLSVGQDNGSTAGNVYFDNTETIDAPAAGQGTIALGLNTANQLIGFSSTAATITFGHNLTLRLKAGSIAPYAYSYYYPDAFINQGSMVVDAAARTVTVNFGPGGGNAGAISIAGGTATLTSANQSGFSWSNSGTIQVTGGTLNLSGTWSNSGTLNVSGAMLNLGGSFSSTDAAHFSRSGSTVSVTGTMDNTGRTLTLAGPYTLSGTIFGGTVSGTELIPANGTLKGGVIVTGDLDLAASSRVLRVAGDLAVGGTIFLGNDTGGTAGQLDFTADCTLKAGGGVVFGGNASNWLDAAAQNVTCHPGARPACSR